jgi:hypothetical protein
MSPDEWTFSRAFAEFSASRLPERIHEAFIKKSYEGEIAGHNPRDSTAILALSLSKGWHEKNRSKRNLSRK